MKVQFLLVFIVSLPVLAFAQKKITISGYVRDISSKEAVIGASVINANTKSGTTTDIVILNKGQCKSLIYNLSQPYN